MNSIQRATCRQKNVSYFSDHTLKDVKQMEALMKWLLFSMEGFSIHKRLTKKS